MGLEESEIVREKKSPGPEFPARDEDLATDLVTVEMCLFQMLITHLQNLRSKEKKMSLINNFFIFFKFCFIIFIDQDKKGQVRPVNS